MTSCASDAYQRLLYKEKCIPFTAFGRRLSKRQKVGVSGTTTAASNVSAANTTLLSADCQRTPCHYKKPQQRKERGKRATFYHSMERAGAVHYNVCRVDPRAHFVQEPLPRGRRQRRDDTEPQGLGQACGCLVEPLYAHRDIGRGSVGHHVLDEEGRRRAVVQHYGGRHAQLD
jgi:hypothetical protein